MAALIRPGYIAGVTTYPAKAKDILKECEQDTSWSWRFPDGENADDCRVYRKDGQYEFKVYASSRGLANLLSEQDRRIKELEAKIEELEK